MKPWVLKITIQQNTDRTLQMMWQWNGYIINGHPSGLQIHPCPQCLTQDPNTNNFDARCSSSRIRGFNRAISTGDGMEPNYLLLWTNESDLWSGFMFSSWISCLTSFWTGILVTAVDFDLLDTVLELSRTCKVVTVWQDMDFVSNAVWQPTDGVLTRLAICAYGIKWWT